MSQTTVLTPAALSARIRARAQEMGFDDVGIAPVRPGAHVGAYDRWLALGMHGEMGYLAREDAVAKRHDAAVLVPGARSAVVVALHYDPRGATTMGRIRRMRRAGSSPATPATTTTTS